MDGRHFKWAAVLFMAFAALPAASAELWSSWTKIAMIYPAADGMHFMTATYSNAAVSTCDHGKRFVIASNHPNYSALSSALMGAFYASREINFVIADDSKKACSPLINRFQVR